MDHLMFIASFNEYLSLAEIINSVYGIAYLYFFMNICRIDPLVAANHWKIKIATNAFVEMLK
jgi:hypothetical protein